MLEFIKYRCQFFEKKFAQICLENGLYIEPKYKVEGRLKKIYTGELGYNIPFNAVLAKYNGQFVGVILCEQYLEFNNALILNNPNVQHSLIKEKFDWGFQRVGKINLFVKEEFRGRGIATELVKKMEKARILDYIHTNGGLGSYNKYLFEAQGLAFDIWQKHNTLSYVTAEDRGSWNKKRDIHFLTMEAIHKMQKGIPIIQRNTHHQYQEKLALAA